MKKSNVKSSNAPRTNAPRKSFQLKNVAMLASAATLAALGLAGGLWWHGQPRHTAPAPLVYSANGYGGFMPAPAAPKPSALAAGRAAPAKKAAPPEQVAQAAYAAGQYAAAETAAAQVVAQAARQPTLPRRKAAAQAGSLLAYAAARRHDLRLARVRFATAQKEAAVLPDKGQQPALIGQPTPATLEEDDAFQHAVCTGALGDKPAAEAEYVAFLHRFPDSPLVPASIKRIARMHGGDIPPADEAVWREAMRIDAAHQKAKLREASLCGPECLSELLRRRGERASVHALAAEMHTSDQGTSLEALADAARTHGYSAQGLALTQKGLAEQTLPVIALIAPGHYLLVEAVAPAAVTAWDPDAHGQGKGDARTLPLADWQRRWHGIALALTPEPARVVRTAQR